MFNVKYLMFNVSVGRILKPPHGGLDVRNTKYEVCKAPATRSTYNIVAGGLQSPYT